MRRDKFDVLRSTHQDSLIYGQIRGLAS